MTSPAVKLLAASGGAASEPFATSSLIEAWWAEDLVGTYSDTDVVDSWPGHLGVYTMTASSTQRPVFRSSSINSQPAVDFDGSNDIMRVGVSDFASSESSGVVIAVVNYDTTAGNDTVWASADEATNTHYILGRVAVVSSAVRIAIGHGAGGTADVIRSTSAFAAGVDRVIEWSSTGTAYELREANGVLAETVQSGSDSGDWFADATNRDNLTLGGIKPAAEGDYYDGRIAWIGFYDSTFSAGDRTAVYDWINDVYGV